MKARLPLFCLLLSALAFALFRLYAHSRIAASGLVDAGLLQYDSYYPLSFAQELAREGSWLWFQSPFGSGDTLPGLAHPLSSLLLLLRPLWMDHLFAFDLAWGTLFAAIGGFFFGRALETIAGTGRRAFALAAWTILGGGIAFSLSRFFPGWFEPHASLYGFWWGLTWIANFVSSWELLYHALFWAGLAFWLRARLKSAAAAGLALMILHPFSAAIFTLTLSALGAESFLRDRAQFRRERAPLAVLLGAMAVTWAFYNALLPSRSADAAFFLLAYKRNTFTVDPSVVVLYAAPSVLLLLAAWMQRYRSVKSAPGAAAFAIVAASLLLVDLLGPITERFLPQPAHWLRVYPLAFLVLAAASFHSRPLSPRRHLLRNATFALGLAFVVGDSILGAEASIRDLSDGPRPPITLRPADFALFESLKKTSAGRLVYVRSCAGPADFPKIEYALSALTPHRVGFGHAYFSREPLLPTPVCADRDDHLAQARKRIGTLGSGDLLILDDDLNEALGADTAATVFIRHR